MNKLALLLALIPFLLTASINANEVSLDQFPEQLRKGEVNGILSQFSEQPQMLAQVYSIMGRPDKAYDLIQRFSNAPFCNDVGGYEKIFGEARVKSMLADESIFMINENHFNPASRTLTMTWLPWLKAQGFTHIGFEALEPNETSKDGFYSQEPMMSNLIKTAEELGFEVFGYEAEKLAPEDAGFIERFEFRDKQQAEHVVAEIKKAPKDAKFVLFAGWGHVGEAPLRGPDSTTYRVLGDFLNNTYGYETFSIDTTACAFEPVDESPTTTYAYSNDGNVLNVGSVQPVDSQIRVPMAPADNPSYFRRLLGEAFLPDTDSWPPSTAVILQAYYAGTDVVADRVLSEANKKRPLYLDEGEYRVTLHGLDGNLLWQQRVNRTL
ncbi:hypothetical protein [Idiomarina sp. UBA3162]|uniref:hypothetical protein n=1 Tax=Idiomarina sp. UBA3162 TaxID=1946641 RepID=UPI000C8FC380|nr:hypothetical protein [Idiomarina sp. UBA3162]MAD52829.1 hypothetical protein [Idiomarinaceae bacterium]|tara:strand:- start:663 stop:1802 length:1140 start_codon:yes stop_codon:yes gene_type:complete